MVKLEQVVGTLVSADTDKGELELFISGVVDRTEETLRYDTAELADELLFNIMGDRVRCVLADRIVKKIFSLE